MNKLDSKKLKTRFIMTTFVVAVAMISAINVFNANKNETLSDIAWANVEALAIGEGDGNVKLPCIRNEDDYCTYTVELVSGEKQTRKEYGLQNYN